MISLLQIIHVVVEKFFVNPETVTRTKGKFDGV